MRVRARLAIALLCAALPGRATAESPPSFLLAWGSWGGGNSQFIEPQGIAVDPTGAVVELDHTNGVKRFTAGGVFVAKLISIGPPTLSSPRDLAVGPSGDIYLTGATSTFRGVKQYSSTGTFIGQAGTIGTGPGQYQDAIGIGVDEVGNVFVADYVNKTITAYDASLTYLTQWTIQNPGTNNPVDVAARSGVVYVLCDNDGHVESYTSSGSYVGQFPAVIPGDPAASGYGIAIDAAGAIYIGDDLYRWVKKYSPAGALLTYWNGDDQPGGAMSEPGRVAVDPSGIVYVNDKVRYQVLKYGPESVPASRLTLGRIKALYR